MEKQTSKTNGNGTTGGVKNRRFSKSHDDMKDLSLVVAYVVQQCGAISHAQLGDYLKGIGATVNRNTLYSVMEMLRKKDILAANNTAGEWLYSMKRLKFNCSVENAHVTGMISALEDDPAGQAIKANIENVISQKETKARDTPSDWHVFEALIKLLDPWYGAQPIENNPYLAEGYRRSPYRAFDLDKVDPNDVPLVFERDYATGEIIIPRCCVRGFLKNHLRMAGKGQGSIDLIGVQEIRVTPDKGNLSLTRKPIQRAGAMRANEGTGAGLKYYEVLVPGTELWFEFSGPTKNFLNVAQYRQWLSAALRRPVRSMSPARGTERGAAELLHLESTPVGISELADKKEASIN